MGASQVRRSAICLGRKHQLGHGLGVHWPEVPRPWPLRSAPGATVRPSGCRGIPRSTTRHRLPHGRRCRLQPPSGAQSERTTDVFESTRRLFSMSDIDNPLLFSVAVSSRNLNKNRHLRKRLPKVLPSHSLQPEVTLSEFAKWQKHFLWSWLLCLRSRSLRLLPVRMTYGAAKSPSAWPILTAPPQHPLAAIPWTVCPSSCGVGGRSPDAPRRRSRRLRHLWVRGRCSRPLADEPPLH